MVIMAMADYDQWDFIEVNLQDMRIPEDDIRWASIKKETDIRFDQKTETMLRSAYIAREVIIQDCDPGRRYVFHIQGYQDRK